MGKIRKLIKLLILVSVGAIVVSGSVILYKRFSPIYLKKVSDSNVQKFENQIKKVKADNLNNFKKIIKSNIQETDKEIAFFGEDLKLSLEVLNNYIVIGDKLDLNEESYENFRLTFLELNSDDKFWSKIVIEDLHKYINIFNFYDIKFNNSEVTKILDKHYSKETGFFSKNQSFSASDYIINQELFRSLNKNAVELFKKYYDEQKIVSFFKKENFVLPNNDQNNMIKSEASSLSLISYLDDETKKLLLEEKKVKDWIDAWDKYYAKNKITNEMDFSTKSFFAYNVKKYAKNLETEKQLKERTISLINNDFDNLSLLTTFDIVRYIDDDFLKENNFVDKLKTKLVEIINGKKEKNPTGIKNTAFSYILMNNLEEPLDQKKILFHINKKIKFLEEEHDKNSVITNNSEHLYYISFMVKNYFSEDFKDHERLVKLINQKIETSASISDFWVLAKALMLIQETDKYGINPDKHRRVKRVLKIVADSEKKTFSHNDLNLIEIDKEFQFNTFSKDYFKNILKKLNSGGVGYKRTSFSTGASLETTLKVFQTTKKYFSDDKELFAKVVESSKKLIQKINNENFAPLKSINKIYSYFSLEKLIDDL